MQEKNLFRSFKMQELFDELYVIECSEQNGKAARIGEVNRKQA